MCLRPPFFVNCSRVGLSMRSRRVWRGGTGRGAGTQAVLHVADPEAAALVLSQASGHQSPATKPFRATSVEYPPPLSPPLFRVPVSCNVSQTRCPPKVQSVVACTAQRPRNENLLHKNRNGNQGALVTQRSSEPMYHMFVGGQRTCVSLPTPWAPLHSPRRKRRAPP